MSAGIEKILFQKQIESCQQATARLNIWEGSVSSGKTYGSIWKWMSWIINEAPKTGPFLMVGKTERSLQHNILDPIMEMVGSKRFRLNKGSGEAYFMGRKIYLAGANDERSQDKIRGVTLAGAYGDEITVWPESFFAMLLSRLRIKGARFYGTTNPDSPFHWLKEKYLDRGLDAVLENEEERLDLKRFFFHLDDNPTLNPEYVTNLKREYTGLWYRRFITGEWCQAQGAIYDMWNETTHVISTEDLLKRLKSPPIRRQVVALDYGTSNPTAALLMQAYGNHVHVANEYYYDGRKSQRQKTDKEYMSDIEAFYARNNLIKGSVPLIIDPSAASLKAEARSRGFIVYDADNSVLDGVRTVGTALSSGVLTIDTKCLNLRKEMPSYVWNETAQKHGEDVPLKVNDHCLDACRYGVMELIKSPSGIVGNLKIYAK